MAALVNLSMSVCAEPDIKIPLSDTFISDEALKLFQWIGFSLLCEFIDVFGTVTNIINIVCFIKLGFQDPVNISLLGLAISDFICVATLLWTNICMNPLFQEEDLTFEPLQLQYVTSGWPHVTFSRVTSWITAFITLERCLCVTAPLKVKGLFTSKRVAVIIISLYVILLASVTPVFLVNKLGMVFFPERNKTLLTLVLSEDREQVEQVSFAFNNVFIPFSSYLVIMYCTVILVFKLRSQSKWRRKSSSSTACDNVSSRDQRVIKMVVVISTLFIVCFIPCCIIFIATCVVPDFSVDGKYRNFNIMFIGVSFIFESTNSTVNIFIYYAMSSKYRQVFQMIFRIKSKKISQI